MEVVDQALDESASVLLVDERADDRYRLACTLRDRGHSVRCVPDGEAALCAALSEPPDLLLLPLDLSAPTCLEVCRRWRRRPELAAIPVLAVAPAPDPEATIRVLAAGASDVVAVPFHPAELAARIAAHRRCHRRLRQATEGYAALKEQERLRDALVHMVAHDMRTPLTMVLCNLSIATMQALPDDAQTSVAEALAGTNAMMVMLDSMLDVSRLEAGEMPLRPALCDLAHLVREAVRMVQSPSCRQTVDIAVPPVPVGVDCDPDLVSRVLYNLIGNAVRCSPAASRVVVRILPLTSHMRIEVEDAAPAIPETFRERVFERYGQVECRDHGIKHSSGPGLAFCKLAVEAHHGRIGLLRSPQGGNTFWFELPTKSPAPT